MKFLPLIWRNAVRNRLRTFLTLAGIAFLLFVLIFVMTGLSEIQAWEGVAATHRCVVVQHAEGLMAELPIELPDGQEARVCDDLLPCEIDRDFLPPDLPQHLLPISILPFINRLTACLTHRRLLRV